MSKKTQIILLCIGLACVSAAAFVGGRYYADKRKPNFTSDYTLYVYPETSLDEIMDSLSSGAGLQRAGSLRRCFRKMHLPEQMKPGKYEVDAVTTSIGLARKLAFGWQTADNKLVLSGTLRMKDRIAQKISRQMMVDSTTVMNALNDSVFLSKYDRTPQDIFGLFLKDTYELYWTSSIGQIFDRLYKENQRFWTEERRAKAAAQGLTPKEVEIVASIVTGESLQKKEFPLIAGVYLNRLHKGMKLQADPTIAFCFDYTLDRILRKHLSVDSPYNTYMHKGLPPAPINVPEKAALEAVLDPAQHNYLYFCANSSFDGTHLFAETYAGHMRNARKFQSALNERNRAKAEAEAAAGTAKN